MTEHEYEQMIKERAELQAELEQLKKNRKAYNTVIYCLLGSIQLLVVATHIFY